MAVVSKQIKAANMAICQNIETLTDHRELLSQNVIAQLRNLVEGVAVRLHANSPDAEFDYQAVGPALEYVKSKAKLNFLGKFHKLLQKSASHYSEDGDSSVRLMLKYYEYLHRVRKLLRDYLEIEVLTNLEDFPVDLDPSLRMYHEKIAIRVKAAISERAGNTNRSRYYIHKTRPFIAMGQIYYEITFCRAINRVNKFDRIIAFTDIDVADAYAAMLTLQSDSIEVFGQTMPITIIRGWEVSIRPCEFDNFARLFSISTRVSTGSKEYRNLMKVLTGGRNLLDLMDFTDEKFSLARRYCTDTISNQQIFPMLAEARRIVRSKAPGHNVLRYLMLRMNNQIIKSQYNSDGCAPLSDLGFKYGCIPFDEMPFCTSLSAHNPRKQDLFESLDTTDRNHELFARSVKNNVENHGILYTPEGDLENFGSANDMINSHNNRVYYKHTERHLVLDKGQVFVCGYENDTVNIIKKLQECASVGIAGYTEAVERWFDNTHYAIDDEIKWNALRLLFSESQVALIYGAAGTGKSTMLNHIASYFNDKDKLFLAHTHPAVDNLKRKVTVQNSEFRTINGQIYNSDPLIEYDLLVIDECSTVSNSDLINVLQHTSFKLLVLVGDVYQIESIKFGNWFGIIRSFIPNASVFELTTPYRTKDESLLKFWNKVREIDDDITEIMTKNGYSTVLDKSLFEMLDRDEIILCLNYDGLYGINNINRFLQRNNPGAEFTWGVTTYKIGDPVLFHETDRFRPVVYNNLKGRIVGIEQQPDHIQFDVELNRELSEFDVINSELEWIGESTVRFSVYKYENTSDDDDDDSLNTTVPFQVAYAVSIHKAQGLEYDSVKIVITDANEEAVTHSIFYTAVTRTRQALKIYWTPETQHNVLKRLNRQMSSKDVALLSNRRQLIPV